MTTSVQTLPAGGNDHFSARPLWAAIAVLGVAVVALGASLIHVQTRPLDGHAVFATGDPAAWPEAAPSATTGARLPVATVAPGEVIVPSKPARATTIPATARPAPQTTDPLVESPGPAPTVHRPASPAATVAAAPKPPIPAPAPVAQPTLPPAKTYSTERN